MSRLRKVADIEGRRRDQAGAALSDAWQELSHRREQLQQMMTPTADRQPTSGASMLVHRQAAGRMVERLVEATQAQRAVVTAAREHFAEADKRARQMARAVELDDERQLAARRRAEERAMEDTVMAVTARRRAAPQPDRRRGGRR